jgi:hypothetical protein
MKRTRYEREVKGNFVRLTIWGPFALIGVTPRGIQSMKNEKSSRKSAAFKVMTSWNKCLNC